MSHNKKSILDPNFRYTPSFATDIRKTFKIVRKAFREAKKEKDDTQGKAAHK